jgi:hypothetical protein
MSFAQKVIAGTVILVGIAAALIFFLRDSEEDRIDALFEAGVRAATKGDLEGIKAILSLDFESQEYDYDGVIGRFRKEFRDRRFGTARIAGSSINVDGKIAGATVRVEFLAGPRLLGETVFRVRLRKEEGAWKIVSADRIN